MMSRRGPLRHARAAALLCFAAAMAVTLFAPRTLLTAPAASPAPLTATSAGTVRAPASPTPAVPRREGASHAAPRDTGCVIVRYRDHTGAVRTETRPAPSGVGTARFAREVASQPGVLAAEPDYLLQPADLTYTSEPIDPDYQNAQALTTQTVHPYEIVTVPFGKSWALHGDNSAHFDQVWPALANAKASPEQVHVAIVDTGFYWTHPDAWNANISSAIDECATYDLVSGDLTTDTVTEPVPVFSDDSAEEALNKSHGTMVASEVSAKANNLVGVLGASYDTRVDIYKVQGRVVRAGALTEETYIPESALIHAVDDAVADSKAKGYRLIINISLVLDDPDPTMLTLLRSAIANARAAGAIVVAASGNLGVSSVDYPAAISGVIAVGASTVSADGPVRAAYSNYGSTLDIVAPGSWIWGPTRPGSSLGGVSAPGYTWWTGTSMAAPLVSSAAALLLRMAPDLTPAEVASYLTSGAVDLDATGWDSRTGWGRLDAYRSYLLLVTPRTTANVQPRYALRAHIDFTVSDRDSGSDVATYYSIDGSAPFSGSYAEFSSLGSHTLQYWSVDGNGVREETRTATFEITLRDTQPPLTTSDATSTYAGSATIHLTAVDAPATSWSSSWGVVATRFRIDAGALTTGTVATTGRLGAHWMKFHSVDAAGNEETDHVVTFTVTAVRPTLTIYRTPSTINHGSRVKLWGYLTPARVGDAIRIQVKLPGTNTWRYFTGYSKYYRRTITLVSSGKGSWSPLSYALTRHGRYYFRAYFPGDSTHISRIARYSSSVSVYVR